MSYTHWTKYVDDENFNPILKDHQISILQTLEAHRDQPTGSKEVYLAVNKEGEGVSRGTVINFLEMLRHENIIIGTKATGKGGKRFNYRLHKGATIKNVITQIAFNMIEQMMIRNPDIDFIWIAENLAKYQRVE